MGLFDLFFGKKLIVQHDFFGELIYSSRKNFTGNDYFYAKMPFSLSTEVIELFIDAAPSGPTESQVEFYKEIEMNYASISQSIIPIIEDEFRNWQEDFKIEDFSVEFQPTFIHLPRMESKPIVWEISFDSIHDKNHCFSVTMNDFSAISVLIDG